jgi:hypothetical protein
MVATLASKWRERQRGQHKRGRLWDGDESYFAGGVDVGEVPGVGAGDGEGSGGSDAGPIEDVERATDKRANVTRAP